VIQSDEEGLMRIVLSAASAAIVVALFACSSSGNGSSAGGSSGTLDCAWLASDNCYKTTLAAAMCADAPGTPAGGTLSADGSTCTYANGKVVTFNPPLVLPLSDPPTWSFTVTMNGAMCMQYTNHPQQGIVLTTSAGTASESPAGGMTITCPNGVSYTASGGNGLALLGCDGGITDLPGSIWGSTATSVDLQLLGSGGTSAFAVFTCQR
jgi:hypothetical protein